MIIKETQSLRIVKYIIKDADFILEVLKLAIENAFNGNFVGYDLIYRSTYNKEDFYKI